MMTSFSQIPLQLASVTGFVFTLFGLAVLGYVLGVYLVFGRAVPDSPFWRQSLRSSRARSCLRSESSASIWRECTSGPWNARHT